MVPLEIHYANETDCRCCETPELTGYVTLNKGYKYTETYFAVHDYGYALTLPELHEPRYRGYLKEGSYNDTSTTSDAFSTETETVSVTYNQNLEVANTVDYVNGVTTDNRVVVAASKDGVSNSENIFTDNGTILDPSHPCYGVSITTTTNYNEDFFWIWNGSQYSNDFPVGPTDGQSKFVDGIQRSSRWPDRGGLFTRISETRSTNNGTCEVVTNPPWIFTSGMPAFIGDIDFFSSNWVSLAGDTNKLVYNTTLSSPVLHSEIVSRLEDNINATTSLVTSSGAIDQTSNQEGTISYRYTSTAGGVERAGQYSFENNTNSAVLISWDEVEYFDSIDGNGLVEVSRTPKSKVLLEGESSDIFERPNSSTPPVSNRTSFSTFNYPGIGIGANSYTDYSTSMKSKWTIDNLVFEPV